MFRKITFIIDYNDWSLKGFGWYDVGPASQTVAQYYISIEPMYRVICCFWRRDGKRHLHNNTAVRKHGTITNAVSMSGNIETALGKCNVFVQSLQQTQ